MHFIRSGVDIMACRHSVPTAILLSSVLAPMFFSLVLSEGPVVSTSAGVVSGQRFLISGKKVDAFYGVPYAKPPVGELRFMKPQPAEPWNGTYKATTKPTACKQLDLRFLKGVTLDNSGSTEDCLYLNVWRPANICRKEAKCDRKLPVVVFIYGGGFQWGDSALLVYDAANFVALSDVVFVSFNHRLSLLGFLSVGTPDLPGNVGFWDQLLALKWVQKNIANFGGNPNDVTLGGHSAGAISAGLHAASPFTLRYTKDEETFMEQIVGAWSSFTKTGKMKVPLSDDPWPKYTSKNPEFINMQPGNFTKGRTQRRCELFRPFLLKK
ncbi:acetylcholinesterase-1 [Ixodes scapularis]